MCKAGVHGPIISRRQGTWRANPCMDRDVKNPPHPYEQQSLPEVLAPPATAGSPGGKGHETQNRHNRNSPDSCPGKAVALPALLFSPS